MKKCETSAKQIFIPTDLSRRRRRHGIKYVKITAFILLFGFITYILIALLPYTGRVYVSAETRNTFSMERFHGQYVSPERVMLLECPHDAFFHRVNLISGAQEQILLTSFAIRGGTTSDIIIGALLSAAERGVSITILNNAVGGQMPPRYLRVLSAHSNIDVYLFNRFEFFRPQYINASLHDKYMVVDGTFMILGGRNIGDRDFAPECFDRRISLDREVLVYNTDLSFNGSIVDVAEYFSSKINSERSFLHGGTGRNRNFEEEKNNFIELYTVHRRNLDSYSFDYYYNTVGVNRITLIANPFEGAKKESVVAYNLMMLAKNSSKVIAQSPYVVLTNRNFLIFSDLVNGRDFTLLTNSLASTPNIPSFSSYLVNRRNILGTGITIYEFQSTQSSIHAKTYLFDDRLTAIGSFNINERSIRSDTESMLVIDSKEFQGIVLEAINYQIAQSLRVNADNSYDSNNNVEEADVSFGKRVLYTAAGYVLRIFRFMF